MYWCTFILKVIIQHALRLQLCEQKWRRKSSWKVTSPRLPNQTPNNFRGFLRLIWFPICLKVRLLLSNLSADLRCVFVLAAEFSQWAQLKSSFTTHHYCLISTGLIYKPQLRGGHCVNSFCHVPAITAEKVQRCVSVCPCVCVNFSHRQIVIEGR